jgi:hypothetical protein
LGGRLRYRAAQIPYPLTVEMGAGAPKDMP